MKSFLKITILLAVTISFFSCEKEQEISLGNEIEPSTTMKLVNSKIISEKTMSYVEGTSKFEDQLSLLSDNATSNLTSRARFFDRDIISTTFTFQPGRDSVLINGMIYIYPDFLPSLQRIGWQSIYTGGLSFKYRFEDNIFMIEIPSFSNDKSKWVEIGYGNKSDFSIYVNYKYASNIATWEDYVAYVSPNYKLSTDDNWNKEFIEFLPKWTAVNSFFKNSSELKSGSLINETIKRYDFKATEN